MFFLKHFSCLYFCLLLFITTFCYLKTFQRQHQGFWQNPILPSPLHLSFFFFWWSFSVSFPPDERSWYISSSFLCSSRIRASFWTLRSLMSLILESSISSRRIALSMFSCLWFVPRLSDEVRRMDRGRLGDSWIGRSEIGMSACLPRPGFIICIWEVWSAMDGGIEEVTARDADDAEDDNSAFRVCRADGLLEELSGVECDCLLSVILWHHGYRENFLLPSATDLYSLQRVHWLLFPKARIGSALLFFKALSQFWFGAESGLFWILGHELSCVCVTAFAILNA